MEYIVSSLFRKAAVKLVAVLFLKGTGHHRCLTGNDFRCDIPMTDLAGCGVIPDIRIHAWIVDKRVIKTVLLAGTCTGTGGAWERGICTDRANILVFSPFADSITAGWYCLKTVLLAGEYTGTHGAWERGICTDRANILVLSLFAEPIAADC